MPMHIENVSLLYNTGNCAADDCPGVSRGGGGIVVTGTVLDAATLAGMEGVGADETAVWVPIDVLDPAKLRRLQEYGGDL